MINSGNNSREELNLNNFALENISEAVFLFDTDANIQYVNREACHSLGYSKEELLNMSLLDFAADKTRPEFDDLFQQLRIENNIKFEGIHKEKSGRTLPVTVNASYSRYKEQDYMLFLVRKNNHISRKSKISANQSEVSNRYIDVVNALVVSLDLTGAVVMANRYTCEFLGYTEAEIIGKNWFDIATPIDELETVKLLFTELIKGSISTPNNYENRIISKSGKTSIIAWNNTVLRNDTGEITGTLSSGHDITRHLESERNASEQKMFFQALLESVPAGVFYKDTELRYVFCNSLFSEQIDYPINEILGRTIFDLVEEPIATQHSEADELLLKNPGKVSYEAKSSAKSRHLHFHKASISDPDGSVTGIIGIVLDTTEIKNIENNLEKEKALLSSLIDAIPDLIFIKNTEHEYLGCNKAFERYSGLGKQELIGKKDLGLTPPAVAEFNYEQETTVVNSQQTTLIEEWIPYKDGGGGLFETIKTPFYDEHDSVRGLIGISRNITERRKTETKLQHLSDLDSILANLSKNLFTISSKNIGKVIEEALQNIGITCRLDRCKILCENNITNSYDLTYTWLNPDIQKDTSISCENYRRLLPSIFQQLKNGNTVKILDSSDPPEAHLDDQHALELYGILSGLYIPISEAGNLAGFMVFETINFRRNWIDEEVQILQLLADLIIAYMLRESTTQKLEMSRNQLSETNLQLLEEQQLFVGGPAMVFRWSTNSSDPVRYCTKNIKSILGYTPNQLLNGDILFSDILHPNDRQRVIDEVHSNIRNNIDTFEREYLLRHKDGSYRYFYDFTRVIRNKFNIVTSLHGYLLDITKQKESENERQQIERELRQSQKMEALGQLSGSIAHEFNNMLSVILGHHDLLKNSLKNNEGSINPYLEHIETAGLRAKNLARQLLTFSRPEKADTQRLQIQPLIEGVIKLSRATLPTSITITTNFADNLPDVFIDPGEIQQVLMNLFVNARDAMNSQGNLSISLQRTELKGAECQSCHALIKGAWIELSVADSGSGISKKKLGRIFDPFYTTKPVGEGTGLGLSVVQSILENSGGHILISSKPSKGTTFRLLLPPMQNAESSTPKPDIKETRLPYPSLQGHALLVDDEVGLTEYLQEVLQSCGMTVTSTNDSLHARELFLEASSSYDIIISDQTMPGLTGIDLAKSIDIKSRNIPFLLCTGYTSNEDRQAAEETGIEFILEKPVSTPDLLNAVSNLLATKYHEGLSKNGVG